MSTCCADFIHQGLVWCIWYRLDIHSRFPCIQSSEFEILLLLIWWKGVRTGQHGPYFWKLILHRKLIHHQKLIRHVAKGNLMHCGLKENKALLCYLLRENIMPAVRCTAKSEWYRPFCDKVCCWVCFHVTNGDCFVFIIPQLLCCKDWDLFTQVVEINCKTKYLYA